MAKGHLWSQDEVVQTIEKGSVEATGEGAVEAIGEGAVESIAEGAPAHHTDPRKIEAVQDNLLSFMLS